MRTKKNEVETRVVLRRSSYTPTGYAEYSAADVRCDHGIPLEHLCYQCEPVAVMACLERMHTANLTRTTK